MERVPPSPFINPYASLNAICPSVEDIKPNLKYFDYIDDESVGAIMLGDPGQARFFESASEAAHGTAGLDLRDSNRIAELERQNGDLCRLAGQIRPHKQFLKTALAFLVFFSAVLTIQLFSGTWLIAPALAWVGMAVSASTILLSYLAALDWRDWRARSVPSQ
ncbi:MAG TPA: hypothetical protein VFQ43_05480 [Nitrososphaera sp.]|nr:hypothetical protein [Nitrososphaera sp.]